MFRCFHDSLLSCRKTARRSAARRGCVLSKDGRWLHASAGTPVWHGRAAPVQSSLAKPKPPTPPNPPRRKKKRSNALALRAQQQYSSPPRVRLLLSRLPSKKKELLTSILEPGAPRFPQSLPAVQSSEPPCKAQRFT